MLVQQFPKPKTKKKRPKNNPRPTINDICEVCGRTYAETHEVFFGKGQRQLSIKYKMQIKLCGWDHRESPKCPHKCEKTDKKYKRRMQKVFEEKYGHEKFMEVFKKNYL